jgi:hypothetical protein
MFIRPTLWASLFTDLATASLAVAVISYNKISFNTLLLSLFNGIIYLIIAELVLRLAKE